MTEEEARKFIEANSQRHMQLREKVVAIKTRADEGKRQIGELLDLAEAKLGTRDETKIQEIFKERQLTNGTRAKTWIDGIEACENELATIARAAAPGR